jgi:hypothetical protein
MQMRYIKTNYTKHISLKLFYPHELQEGGKISILQIKSCNNLVNLFIKSLPLATFDKCVKDIGMHRLKDLQGLRGDYLWIRILWFLINIKKNILLVLQESSYMTNSIIQGGVLQIYLQDSNTSLNHKLMASLTSHTKQHERLHLIKTFQREDQGRTKHITRNWHQSKWSNTWAKLKWSSTCQIHQDSCHSVVVTPIWRRHRHPMRRGPIYK